MNLKKANLALLTVGILFMANGLRAEALDTINQNNTNLVPLRVISEELGASVNYDAVKKRIDLKLKSQTVEAFVGSKKATVNGNPKELQVAAQVINGTTYVPIRFVGEALGGSVDYQNGKLKILIDGKEKEWTLQEKKIQVNANKMSASSGTFSSGSRSVAGKNITYATVNMNDANVKVRIATANNTVTQAQALKSLASGAKLAVNGTYFAAYNGAVPQPDGTLVSNKRTIHITDIGSTIGFTSDNRVLIDFVKTRIQGYINGEKAWESYRVNRPTTDTSTNIIYTPEYGKEIPLANGWSSVVCINGTVEKIVNQAGKVPAGGLIIATTKPGNFQVGDKIELKTVFYPKNTPEADWEKVVHALSAGPSLRINGQKTGDPANENFTEAKILTNSAQRTFIGVDANNKLMIGTVSASVSQLKDLVGQLNLQSAIYLDGGASSGLYYNGKYLTSPGRNISNAILFS